MRVCINRRDRFLVFSDGLTNKTKTPLRSNYADKNVIERLMACKSVKVVRKLLLNDCVYLQWRA